MPAKFITPPLTLWGLTNTPAGEQLLLQCVNTSTVAPTARSHGDIVIPDTTTNFNATQFAAAPATIGGGVINTATTPSYQALGLVSVSGDASVTSQTIPQGNA